MSKASKRARKTRGCQRIGEQRNTPQIVAPTMTGGTPMRAQNDSHPQEHFSWGLKIAIPLLVTIIGGLIILLLQRQFAYQSLQTDYNSLKITNEEQQKKINRLEPALKNALMQHEILNHLGPNIFSFQRLTVGRNSNATQIYVGRCPDLPCYKVKYEGIENGEKGSMLSWLINGESREHLTMRMNDVHFLFPAQALCYGKIPVTNDYTIILILERITTPDTFDVTVGLVKTDTTAPFSSKDFSVSISDHTGCFNE